VALGCVKDVMKYPSPADIEEMKARGYERSTIEEVLQQSKRWHEAESAELLNKCSSSLSFFDDEGMRFHLPAYLIADLNGEYRFGMAFALTQSSEIDEQFWLLNQDQREAVRR
jgi:hypothetical protein